MRKCAICGKPLSLVPGLVCLDHRAVDMLWGMVVRGTCSDWHESHSGVTHAEMQISPAWKSEKRWEAEVLAALAGKGVQW